jgi:hypothetical protein
VIGMEEEALRLMRVLTDHGCESGPVYSDAWAQNWFREAGLDDDEVERGLVVARDKGWLIIPRDRPGRFKITQSGYDAAVAAAG